MTPAMLDQFTLILFLIGVATTGAILWIMAVYGQVHYYILRWPMYGGLFLTFLAVAIQFVGGFYVTGVGP